MSELIPGWETGKIASIAPDDVSLKAARKLALPAKWQALGNNREATWGLLKGSGSKPYQVMLDLDSLQTGPFAFRCTCPSRKQPCKHVLALLLIAAEQPDAVKRQVETAPFVAKWLARRAEQTTMPSKSKKALSTKQQARSAAARMEKIAAGLDELEPWLFDILRQGLGDPRLKAIPFWTARAARLVDAQAPGLATRLRTLPIGAHHRTDYNAWAGEMLAALGQIYLTLQAFRQYDRLPDGLQADLRTALGWSTRQEELADEPAVHDRWLVLGRREELVEERLRQQRLWLLGLDTGRFALILEFAFGNASFETSLHPGEAINAGLVFYPSGAPLRAFAREIKPVGRVFNSTVELITRPITVSGALAEYAAALAANPWLIQFPLLLGPVWPQQVGDDWMLRGEAGEALPVVSTFWPGWQLLALSGGHPLTVFGEWDGRLFRPLAALADGRLADLPVLEMS